MFSKILGTLKNELMTIQGRVDDGKKTVIFDSDEATKLLGESDLNKSELGKVFIDLYCETVAKKQYSDIDEAIEAIPVEYRDVQSRLLKKTIEVMCGSYDKGSVLIKEQLEGALSESDLDDTFKGATIHILSGSEFDSSKADYYYQLIINYIRSTSWHVTRFEKARIVGARALQIAYGAPVLVDYPADLIDPIDIALLEYDADLIPISVIHK